MLLYTPWFFTDTLTAQHEHENAFNIAYLINIINYYHLVCVYTLHNSVIRTMVQVTITGYGKCSFSSQYQVELCCTLHEYLNVFSMYIYDSFWILSGSHRFCKKKNTYLRRKLAISANLAGGIKIILVIQIAGNFHIKIRTYL